MSLRMYPGRSSALPVTLKAGASDPNWIAEGQGLVTEFHSSEERLLEVLNTFVARVKQPEHSNIWLVVYIRARVRRQ